MKTRILGLLLLVTVCALPLRSGYADVNLTSDQSSYTVAFGNTFNVTISLQITGTEHVSGVDYYLQELSSAGFAIVGRNTTGAPWTDGNGGTYFTDAQVTSSADSQSPAGADNALNPRNDYDVGGSSNTSNFTSSASPYALATFTFSTAGVAVGDYTLGTTSNTGTGWVDTTFTDNTFNNQASFIVHVTGVPEPATWSLFGLGGVGAFGLNFLRRRRHS